MFQVRKLKPDRSIKGLIYPLALLLIFGLSSLIFGIAIGFLSISVGFGFYSLYCLYIFFRTGNTEHLVVFADCIFVSTLLILAILNKNDIREVRDEWKIAYITGIIFFGVLIVYLVYTKRLKWRGREIFELTAQPVTETGDGYTPRPRPVGRVEFSQKEILAFAHFCTRHLISIVYISPNQVAFVPIKMGDEYSFLFKPSHAYLESTWIAFGFDGDVSVHIAQNDYLDYQEPPAFDPLCESLGRLFIEFAEMFRRGEGVRIIDRLNALQLNYFS